MTSRFSHRSGPILAVVTLAGALAIAQPATPIAALRTTPTEKFTVNPGFRDWARPVMTGTTIIAGNSSNRGGLFAVDTVAGKLKWTLGPTGTASGNPFVATAPAVSGDLVIVPMGNTLVAASIATGREAWRGPKTALQAVVAADNGLAFVLGEDENFHALDAATGREKWTQPFQRRGSCSSLPVAKGGSVYVVRDQNLVALDATTGAERWKYPTSLCPEDPLVSGDNYFAIGSQKLYGINLTTGRELWAPIEVRGQVDGRDRFVEIGGLVDAGAVVIGVTPVSVMAFDKATGKIAWQIAGQYRPNFPSTAVAGDVLYVQGHPGKTPSNPALPGGNLNAIDLKTRNVLWSFSRPTAEANWNFGFVTPVDGGLWVDSYQALVKLQ